MKKADEAKINKVLTELWRKNLPTLRERLDLLDRAATTAASGTLAEVARTEALNVAHKLSGSLGMFGYQKGTEIAHQMELILRSPHPGALAKLPSLTKDLRHSIFPSLRADRPL